MEHSGRQGTTKDNGPESRDEKFGFCPGKNVGLQNRKRLGCPMPPENRMAQHCDGNHVGWKFSTRVLLQDT